MREVATVLSIALVGFLTPALVMKRQPPAEGPRVFQDSRPASVNTASEPTTNPTLDRERVLDAIEFVESGGRGADTPDGDGGLAIGPFQIHEIYWTDAVDRQPDLRERGYTACRDPQYARAVVRAYLARYHANTAEQMARIHNGGPRGMFKNSTLPYWDRVRDRLR